MPGIIYIVYLEVPHNIIDYTQEAGYTGRAGEYIMTIIIVKDKDWPAKDSRKDNCLELKTREVNNLIRITGYRYNILGRSLDNDLRDYKGINIVLYNNY